MTRLNQLLIPNEGKLGLAIVAVYILVDSAISRVLGGYHIAGYFGAEFESPLVGAVQLVAIALLFLALHIGRSVLLSTRLNLDELKTRDPTIEPAVAQAVAKVTPKLPRLAVTGNMGDSNAFCLPAGRHQQIILGGALRLLFRRRPRQVLAIVSHEASHVHDGDVVLIVLTWYLLLAYASLSLLHFSLVALKYIVNPDLYLRWFQRSTIDLGGWPLALAVFFYAAIGLTSVLGVWLSHSHLIRSREYFADERAAQAGYRDDLVGLLTQSPRAEGFWDKFHTLFSFHPMPDARRQSLLSDAPWERASLPLIFAMTFILTRLTDSLGNNEGISEPHLPSSSVDQASQLLLTKLEFSDFAVFLFGFGQAVVISIHLHRTFVTQTSNGAGLLYRLSTLALPLLAAAVGAFAATISSWDNLYRLLVQPESWSLALSFDRSIVVTIGSTILFGVVACSVAAVTPLLLKLTPRSHGLQTLQLILLALPTLFIVQAVAGLIFYFFAVLGVSIPSYPIEALPYSSQALVSGGPNIWQMGVFFLLPFLSLLVLRLAGVIRKSTVPRTYAPWRSAV